MSKVFQISVIADEIPQTLYDAFKIKSKSLHMITTYYEGEIPPLSGGESCRLVIQHIPPEFLAKDQKAVSALMTQTIVVLVFSKELYESHPLSMPTIFVDESSPEEIVSRVHNFIEYNGK